MGKLALKSGLVLALVAAAFGCYDASNKALSPVEVAQAEPALAFATLPPQLAGKAHNGALAHVLRELTISARRKKFTAKEVLPAAEASLNRYLALRGEARVNLKEVRTAAQPYIGASQTRIKSSDQPIAMAYYGSPEGYMNEILDVSQSSPTPADVQWQVDMIIQRASATLYGTDLDGVIAIGSVAVSSAYYWEAEGQAWMDFCYNYVHECQDSQMITPMGRWNWGRTVGADVAGGMLGWAFGPGVVAVAAGASLADGVAQAIERIFES